MPRCLQSLYQDGLESRYAFPLQSHGHAIKRALTLSMTTRQLDFHIASPKPLQKKRCYLIDFAKILKSGEGEQHMKRREVVGVSKVIASGGSRQSLGLINQLVPSSHEVRALALPTATQSLDSPVVPQKPTQV